MSWLSDPHKLRRFHAVMTVVWIAAIPVSLLTLLKDSVPWLVFISLWALVGAHWGAWQAVRVEDEPSLNDADIRRIVEALRDDGPDPAVATIHGIED